MVSLPDGGRLPVPPERAPDTIVSDNNCNFITPSAGTNKAYFSTLAPDPSDEIGEFDEENMTGGKQRIDIAALGTTVELSRPNKRSVRGDCLTHGKGPMRSIEDSTWRKDRRTASKDWNAGT